MIVAKWDLSVNNPLAGVIYSDAINKIIQIEFKYSNAVELNIV